MRERGIEKWWSVIRYTSARGAMYNVMTEDLLYDIYESGWRVNPKNSSLYEKVFFPLMTFIPFFYCICIRRWMFAENIVDNLFTIYEIKPSWCIS